MPWTRSGAASFPELASPTIPDKSGLDAIGRILGGGPTCYVSPISVELFNPQGGYSLSAWDPGFSVYDGSLCGTGTWSLSVPSVPSGTSMRLFRKVFASVDQHIRQIDTNTYSTPFDFIVAASVHSSAYSPIATGSFNSTMGTPGGFGSGGYFVTWAPDGSPEIIRLNPASMVVGSNVIEQGWEDLGAWSGSGAGSFTWGVECGVPHGFASHFSGSVLASFAIYYLIGKVVC